MYLFTVLQSTLPLQEMFLVASPVLSLSLHIHLVHDSALNAHLVNNFTLHFHLCGYQIMQREAIHNMSAHKLSWCYQPQRVLLQLELLWSHDIIIIMSCCKNGYPWASLTTFPYRTSPLAGLQDYILYPHIAAVCMFELVVLLLLGHMWGSITYELVPASLAVSCVSGSSNLDSFHDGRQVAV